MDLAREYLENKPSERITILELDIPCSSECLEKSVFVDLLKNPSFKSQIEVVDSLKDLIITKVNDLIYEISNKVSFNVDINNLAFSIYRIIEYGGDFQIGYDSIKFEDRVIFTGSFEQLMKLNREIERILNDSNIKSTCDEIRYLTESLWVHFDKNIRRVLVEDQSRP